MTFLGRKLHANFQAEVLTDSKKKRWPGARVKQRVKENRIKMYDKHGCVLRIETVINQPREFKVRRRGKRKGRRVTDWFPLLKGVGHLFRYAQIARAANGRYLDALAAVEPPVRAAKAMHRLARPVRQAKRSFRGFNPALEEDLELFAALLRGEHAIHGIRNETVRQHLAAKVSLMPCLAFSLARASRSNSRSPARRAATVIATRVARLSYSLPFLGSMTSPHLRAEETSPWRTITTRSNTQELRLTIR